MQHPRATGVIFRKTTASITNPGALWDEAVSMYSSVYPKGLKIRTKKLEVVFPNGAVLKFSHLQYENDKYQHKGGQYSFVAFDEVTDFSEDSVIYLTSRMRNVHVDYKPQMFLTTNPDYNHWTRLYVQDYYLDKTTGIPDQSKAGHKRYFFRQGNTVLWYNSKAEAEAVHGVGDESGIQSFTFWPATCRDNPPLLKSQPDYISKLMSLPRVEMERLLLGSWFAREEASSNFKREWCKIVTHRNGRAFRRVRAYDLAMSLPSEQYKDPDWTRGVLMSKDKLNVYTVEDVVSLRDRSHVVEKLIFDTAEKDGTGTIIVLPQDPNAAAGAYARDLQRRLAEKGFTCRLVKPVKSKMIRFSPFSSVSQAGFVNIVEGHWNTEYFDELEIFNGGRENKDDQVDATSDAFYILNNTTVIPDFKIPELPKMNTFDFSCGF